MNSKAHMSSLVILLLVGLSAISCGSRIVTVSVHEMRGLIKGVEGDSLPVLAVILKTGDSLNLVDGSVHIDTTEQYLSGIAKGGGDIQIDLDQAERIYMRTDRPLNNDVLFIFGVGVVALIIYGVVMRGQ